MQSNVVDLSAPLWNSPIINTQAAAKQAIQKASQTANLVEKRAHYEAAYQTFRVLAQADGSLPPELELPFFHFLEAYAKDTCYAQAGDGFKKSALLMQLSFLLQLKNQNIIDFSYHWSKSESLEDLIKDIGLNQGNFSDLFSIVYQLKIAPEAVGANRDIMAATLRLMTFSHQNIPDLAAKKFYPFHQRYNDLTEALFDQHTEQGQLDLAEYKYNRCAFLIKLQELPEDEAKSKKLAAYDEVLALYKRLCTSPALQRTLQGKMSQINNMKGIILRDTPAQAEIHFQEAFILRAELLKTAGQGSDSTGATDEFLLCNIRTGLIGCLLLRNAIAEARTHADALEVYMEKNKKNNNVHDYFATYQKAIDKVKEFENYE